MTQQRPCITIVGTGLIGTSMGMAILNAKGKDIEIVGHDKDVGQVRLAQRMGAVSRTERNLISACSRADMIILAMPIAAMRETMQLIAGDLKSGCVVTDVGALKVPVLQWADEILPEDVSFVGGDPILFGDDAGIAAARADLFKGTYYCVTPSSRATSEAVKLVTDMVTMMGAMPHFIDPHEHDGLVGGTEHLADVVAATLLHTLSTSGGWRDMRKVCGATFDRVTCFSQADPSEYSSRALLNRENLLRWLDTFQAELGGSVRSSNARTQPPSSSTIRPRWTCVCIGCKTGPKETGAICPRRRRFPHPESSWGRCSLAGSDVVVQQKD